MKKAVIITGGKQYLVAEGDSLEVELLGGDEKSVSFEPLLVIDGEKTQIGRPTVVSVKVTATVTEPDVKTDKVTAIRYKSKKRVRKIRGHRQRRANITIKKITV